MTNIKSIKYQIRQAASAFIGCIVGLLIIEATAEALGIPHAIKPKGKLARLLYISETARVPIMIGVAILLSPITIADKIKARFFAGSS